LLRWPAGRRCDQRDIVSTGKIDRAPVRRDHEPIDDELHDASVPVATSQCKNAALRLSSPPAMLRFRSVQIFRIK
jgi:hypothetical protein